MTLDIFLDYNVYDVGWCFQSCLEHVLQIEMCLTASLFAWYNVATMLSAQTVLIIFLDYNNFISSLQHLAVSTKDNE